MKRVSKKTTTKRIIVAAIIAINLFTIACLLIQYLTATEISSTLITCYYSFWTVEIFSMAGIKIVKVKKGIASSSESEIPDALKNINEDEE